MKKPYKINSLKVIKALEKLERETIRDTGVFSVSGGFSKVEIFDYDDDYFDIELKWGVQSDCQNTVHTEAYKMDRITLKIKEA